MLHLVKAFADRETIHTAPFTEVVEADAGCVGFMAVDEGVFFDGEVATAEM